MQNRRIGDRDVSAIGVGEMQMSIENRPDEDTSIRTIHAALDAGATFIDTADAYALNTDEHGHGERLVAAALRSWSGDAGTVLVATKGGHIRPGDGSWQQDGSPAYLRKAAENSLQALGTDVIGLYQFHRPDPKFPFEDSVGALKELYDAGTIARAGISNVTVDQIKAAQRILGDALVSVQNQFGPNFRSSQGELDYCASQGLAFLPWGPLGGVTKASDLGSAHAAFAEVGKAHDVSPQQVALAWELAKAPVVIPIPGTRRPETILDSLQAVDLVFSQDELAALDAA